tara:strand:- start:105 stop:476 length:372 start_codon:yes stop_codon:yes gene_type:complete
MAPRKNDELLLCALSIVLEPRRFPAVDGLFCRPFVFFFFPFAPREIPADAGLRLRVDPAEAGLLPPPCLFLLLLLLGADGRLLLLLLLFFFIFAAIPTVLLEDVLEYLLLVFVFGLSTEKFGR